MGPECAGTVGRGYGGHGHALTDGALFKLPPDEDGDGLHTCRCQEQRGHQLARGNREHHQHGGSQAGQIVSQLGLSLQQPVFRSDCSDRIYEIVHDMMEHNTFSVADVLERNGQLNLFLSVIASSAITEKNDPASANNYVQKAVSFIRGNYYNPIRITDVAAYSPECLMRQGFPIVLPRLIEPQLSRRTP